MFRYLLFHLISDNVKYILRIRDGRYNYDEGCIKLYGNGRLRTRCLSKGVYRQGVYELVDTLPDIGQVSV